MKSLLFSLLLFTLFLTLISSSCKREPYKPDFEQARSYVIGKEICKSIPSEDFWLIDFSEDLNRPNLNYGDTITINGILYKHMVKTKQLAPQFQLVGKRVSFDFRLSNTMVQTTGCTIANPIIYSLKEMTVIASFEIR